MRVRPILVFCTLVLCCALSGCDLLSLLGKPGEDASPQDASGQANATVSVPLPPAADEPAHPEEYAMVVARRFFIAAHQHLFLGEPKSVWEQYVAPEHMDGVTQYIDGERRMYGITGKVGDTVGIDTSRVHTMGDLPATGVSLPMRQHYENVPPELHVVRADYRWYRVKKVGMVTSTQNFHYAMVMSVNCTAAAEEQGATPACRVVAVLE